jgi:hypothetical protein
MSTAKAKLLLSQGNKISDSEIDKVIHCVSEHHGIKNFYCLESEIVCNADCYRFVSIKGVIGGMRYTRDMDLEDLAKLYLNKAEEKWSALTFDICKNELRPQYKIIKEFLSNF